MRYKDLDSYVKYLNSFPRLSPAEYLSLERIKQLLALLGNPERKLCGFQVAGTNGKGSVVAMLRASLMAAGFKVGTFTSPHLVSYTERFKINEQNISPKNLAKIITQLEPKIIKLEEKINDRLTWFELLTAAAILYFTKQKVDYAVFEVGLGGRFDATTVLPLRTKIITNISLDHTKILGNTREKIAFEKAGIVKSAKDKLIIGETNPKILKAIIKPVKKISRQIYPIEKQAFKLRKIDLSGTEFALKEIGTLKTNLIGVEHPLHAAMVWEALKQSKINISPDQFKKGLLKVKWPGRFQVINKNPLTVLDGAHNPAGIRNLLKNIQALNLNPKHSVAIMAIKRVKDVKNILKIVSAKIPNLIFPKLTNIPYLENLLSGADLKKLHHYGIVVSSLTKAIPQARQLVKKDGLIIYCGSLYFIGEFLRKNKPTKIDTIDDSDYLRRN